MRPFKIVSIILVILCITAVSGLLLLNNVANRFIDEGLAELVEDQTAGDVMDNNTSNNNRVQDDILQENKLSDTEIKSNDDIIKTGEPIKVETGGENSVPDEQPQSNEGAGQSKLDNIKVEELKEVNNEIPVKEKLEVTKMVMSKLSGEEISALSAMASGGVNAEEKKKAKQIVYSKFTAEEIQYLKELYYKYLK